MTRTVYQRFFLVLRVGWRLGDWINIIFHPALGARNLGDVRRCNLDDHVLIFYRTAKARSPPAQTHFVLAL
jgi:hypothetical protein